MSEIRRKSTLQPEADRRAREWADQIPDEEEAPSYEPTYRDGTLKNECWNQEDY